MVPTGAWVMSSYSSATIGFDGDSMLVCIAWGPWSQGQQNLGRMCRMHKVNRLHIFGLICSCSKRSPILRPSNISSLAQATFSSCESAGLLSFSTPIDAIYLACMYAFCTDLIECCRWDNGPICNLPISTGFDPQDRSLSLQARNPATGMFF